MSVQARVDWPEQPAGPEGLSAAEAARRLVEDGPNELEAQAATPWWRMLLAQVKSPLVALLAGACVLAAALGEWVDALAIGTIVLLNSVVGFLQESRAERAVLALRNLTAPRARVLRDGRSEVVPARTVVRGDVLLLEAGDVVAADARLLEAHVLSTREAALTGESAPVEKSVQPAAPDAPLAERRDSVFMGTAVANGSGRARVLATGMRTELGRIAHLIESAEESATPLQRRLAQLSRVLLLLCLGIVALVAVLGLLRGDSALEVLLAAVSLAVAAVPEGLPAVVTIALAVGVQRMAARHVLVRRLPAVETLGAATVICTDKTGTLTTGVMAVRELWGEDHARVLEVAAACSDAELGPDGASGVGDPTEVALLAAAAQRGVHRATLEHERPRRYVNPFDAERRRMSVLRADGTLYVKGGVEAVLAVAARSPRGVREAADEMAARGLRVLAMAVGQGTEERELEVVGLAGIADPPRTEAIAALDEARGAGVTTVMITGDHPTTAAAIARELGLVRPGEEAAERVHARATPEDKLRIVREWKARDAVVVMTGDGVNDAPALREAHVGVAMGRTGTEVTREAADVVLADDNFASIVAGVREGRGIFDNIRKTLVYLLAGNAAELAVMLGAAVAGLPLPLLPVQLLWINLVTDGLPALALVVEPVEPGIMQRLPRSPREAMLGRPQWASVLWVGAVQLAVTLGVFVWALRVRDLVEARNLAFSVLVFGELFRAFGARSPDRLFWELGAFTNLRLLGVVVFSVLVQLGLHHIPAGQALFRLGPLSLGDCLLTLGLGLVPLSAIELNKLVRRALRRAEVGR